MYLVHAGAVTAAASAALEALSVTDWLLPDCRVCALLLQHAPQTAQSVRMRQYDWPTRCWPSVARNAVHGNRATMVSSDSIVVQQMRQTAARNKAKKPPEQHVVQLDVAGGDAEAVAVVHGRNELLEQRARPRLWQRPTLQRLRDALKSWLCGLKPTAPVQRLPVCILAVQRPQTPAFNLDAVPVACDPDPAVLRACLLSWQTRQGSRPVLTPSRHSSHMHQTEFACTSFSMCRSTASDMSPPSACSMTSARWFLQAAVIRKP